MKIKNGEDVGVNEGRKAVLSIIEVGLEAIDTQKAIQRKVVLEGNSIKINGNTFSLNGIKRIFLVAVGKCALEAAGALEGILGSRITDGIVLDVVPGGLKKIKVRTGTHPFPSEANVAATEEIISLLEECREDDCVFFVISGGGSTLLCAPTNFSYLKEVEAVKVLFEGGATIEEMNTLRKHLSYARGGFLAKYAAKAKVISLIFSDVPGDDIEFIASGPTVKDRTTKEEAISILEKYEIEKRCALGKESVIETPKEDKYWEKASNILFLSNQTALEAMKEKGESLGLKARICETQLRGEASAVGSKIIEELHESAPRTLLLYGGETTVTVKNKGAGGRNQEVSLGGLKGVREGEVLISVASDGNDKSEVAGGFCDTLTKRKAESLGLDPEEYLRKNNSFEFFRKTGDHLYTGKTGSNVSDLIVAIKV